MVSLQGQNGNDKNNQISIATSQEPGDCRVHNLQRLNYSKGSTETQTAEREAEREMHRRLGEIKPQMPAPAELVTSPKLD